MKYLMGYWIIGCLIVGTGAGMHHARCPADDDAAPSELIVSVAIWPAGMPLSTYYHVPPACKRLP